MFLNKKEFISLIKNAPLISIDFCIVFEGKLLLGKRKNPPAKNVYFVPGGRIQKNETLKSAQKRLLADEIGLTNLSCLKKGIKFMGIFEHFYEDNFLGQNDFNTHYIAHAYKIELNDLNQINYSKVQEQHDIYKWLSIEDKFLDKNNKIEIHKYTQNYIKELII